jgi:hypothetical protein
MHGLVPSKPKIWNIQSNIAFEGLVDDRTPLIDLFSKFELD